MTVRIKPLAPILIDKIAAGEVIESPASIIKELVENALDAGARRITIVTEAGGMEKVQVEDDGGGIHPDDMAASITRHATSKINTLADLENLNSLGFRGEALAAIAAISHLQIKSRSAAHELGAQLICRGGEVLQNEAVKHAQGTSIAVSNLFYSTPARRKYLKSLNAENKRNYREIMQLALAVPTVEFRYVRDKSEFAHFPAAQNLRERIISIYGDELAQHLRAVQAEYLGLKLEGYVSTPEYWRTKRDAQFSFVNQRCVTLKNFDFWVRKAYDELLAPGKHPYFFLFLTLDPQRVDVNVHPQKREVRLRDANLLAGLILPALKNILRPRAALGLQQLRYRHQEPFTATAATKSAQIQTELLPKTLQAAPEYVLDSALTRNRAAASIEESALETAPHKDASFTANHVATNNANVDPSVPQAQNANAPAFHLQRHFGTILGTYVVAAADDALYIIDQHTAHERINYERNMRKLAQSPPSRQSLLEPVVINCLADELASILACEAELLASGFVLEAGGPRSYLLREIPSYLDVGSELEVLPHLIHRVLEGERSIQLYKDYAAMRACRASVKKNDQLSGELLSEILQELPKCQEPARCPHGRPTLIKITQRELDRMFQRS